jgi:hypothetical protein
VCIWLVTLLQIKYSAHLTVLHLINRTKLGEQCRSLSSSLCRLFPFPRYLVPLRPKYSPQLPILKHPQPTFLPQCERPSFTPIHNKNISILNPYPFSGPGSVVGISTGYGLDGPGIESQWRPDFPHLPRPTLGPTQPAVQWVLGLSRG